MNAVEIDEAVSELAASPFDAAEFPFAFLLAFGNKETTIKRLRSGSTNASDEGGVLQTKNIHIAVAEPGETGDMLRRLRESPKTARAKARFVLATDGALIEAEELGSSETITCPYSELGNRFGFFLPLAGISTVREVKNNPIDIKATSRLNKLYIELLKENEDWGTAERRQDLNRFMARLIFCFFAEDTDIFNGDDLFTATVDLMSDSRAGNTHEVITELFRAMNTKPEDRAAAGIRPWADVFPYVNGRPFSGGIDCPRFSRIARSYLLRAGELDWQRISPDIFGSMIQAVADDDERGDLGMHYTSVPNIQKVLDPLFLDDLRDQLERAETNKRKLLNLRKRLASIRVFDPACGSGNFLVIAYIRMREIEEELIRRRGESLERSWINLTQFYGIEIKSFAAEIARLSLLIAEFQCDVRMIGQMEARALVLPLHATDHIVTGNALRLDWLEVCPPVKPVPRVDLLGHAPPQEEMDFENIEIETYICGNPPFSGSRKQSTEQKTDLNLVFLNYEGNFRNADYVSGWFIKAAQHNQLVSTAFCFVATNSFCQGQQVSLAWRVLLEQGFRIRFAHTSFKWRNLASRNAGVTVVVLGVDNRPHADRYIFDGANRSKISNINPYLTIHGIVAVIDERSPKFTDIRMEYGVYYSKSSGLVLSSEEREALLLAGFPINLVRKFLGSTEFINGRERYCLWIDDEELDEALLFPQVADRIAMVRTDRESSKDRAMARLALRPHQFRERKGDDERKVFIPIVSSEEREYLPVGIASAEVVPTNKAFYIPDGPLWVAAILLSRTHLTWIATVCGRLRTDYSYSNTLGWNTFPVPTLTETNKSDLTRCAQDILLAREAHFPATIADLYDPEEMPDDLRAAHDRNDEVLERIYIGRRFRNDTERLEKLFDMYTNMTAKSA